VDPLPDGCAPLRFTWTVASKGGVFASSAFTGAKTSKESDSALVAANFIFVLSELMAAKPTRLTSMAILHLLAV
jgi:hypothetical protein